MKPNQLKSRSRLSFCCTLLAVFGAVLLNVQGQAQKKAEISSTSSLCTQESALEIIKQEGKGLTTEKPDQRYTVINAIAKRDPASARKLLEQMLTESASEAKD